MKYRVNALNRKGKEVWHYPNFYWTAQRIQRKAISQGIDSVVYQKINGQYVPYKGIELLSEDDTANESYRNGH